jgi:hypothetical protein
MLRRSNLCKKRNDVTDTAIPYTYIKPSPADAPHVDVETGRTHGTHIGPYKRKEKERAKMRARPLMRDGRG